MKSIGVFLLVVAGAGLLFLSTRAQACPLCNDKPVAAAPTGDTATTGARCTLKVEGMTCGSCAGSVANAAKSVPGVSGADVDLQAGTAVVRYEPQVTDPEAIAQAITKAGFHASVSTR